MAGTPGPGQGGLLARPEHHPYWRRGSWPLWLVPVMWVLLFVRDLPGLALGILGEGSISTGAVTLTGLTLLLIAALGVAVLAPGRLTAQHLGLRRPKLLDVVIWTVASLVALYGVVWLGTVVSATPNQDTNFGMGKDVASDLMLVLGLGSIGPVAEEFAYRATLFRAVTDGVSRWLSPTLAGGVGVVVSSAIFMIAHTGAPAWHLAAYFAFAAVLAVGYWWTGSLYVALVPHLLNNSSIAVTLALAAKASPLVVVVAALGPLLGLGLAYGIGRLLTKP